MDAGAFEAARQAEQLGDHRAGKVAPAPRISGAGGEGLREPELGRPMIEVTLLTTPGKAQVTRQLLADTGAGASHVRFDSSFAFVVKSGVFVLRSKIL